MTPTAPAPATGRPPTAGLEAVLGDPHDPANPLGLHAVLAADERAELLPEGERALDAWGLNAEFVPARLGGRLTDIERLMHVMRAVSRRDPTLALGYGFTNYISGSAVWTSGSPSQQRRMADILLAGGKTAAGYNELPHGNDFTRTDLTATRDGGRLLLDGHKQVVNNIGRADAVVLLARTGEGPGNRSHSHVFVDFAEGHEDRVRRDERFPTAGLRGCLIGGAEFTAFPVPADAHIGPVGGAMETVLRAFQTTRAVAPGMMAGAFDTILRTVTRFTLERRLYGRRVADLPHARATLVAAYADLLAADALTTVSCRALHVLPGQTSVLTAANKYLAPKLLHRASRDLGAILSANSYLRDGSYAIFQKFARDLPAITFAHANASVCLATMLPQLPRMAATSWGHAGQPPAGLFRLDAPLGDIDYQALELTARGADRLTSTLAHPGVAELLPEAAARLIALFRTDLADLRERCLALRPTDTSVMAGRAGYVLADRYAHLAAASACLGIWFHNQHAADPFLASPHWLTAALTRLATRLGHTAALPPETESVLFDALSGSDTPLSLTRT
ncbi:acyl-CoA dehydrogenase family protein [Streptomyces rubiginosohelvolus]|uniref:acyl-CoA dehydrogenase family protein n=1 Tax=Streptomyces rubiginosohelvolus TaxID=67362 RepID=UPI0033DF4D96